MLQRSLTDPPNANETVMASAGLTSIGGNEVDAGTLITLAPKTLYFGAGNYSVPQPLNISRGVVTLVYGVLSAQVEQTMSLSSAIQKRHWIGKGLQLLVIKC